MLYQMWIAHVQPGKVDEYLRAMAEFRPRAEKQGIKVIGAWRVAGGTDDHDVWMLEAYEDYAAYERARKELASDPVNQREWPKVATIRTATTIFLEPTSYSPLQ